MRVKCMLEDIVKQVFI